MKALQSKKITTESGHEIEITALKVKKALQFAKLMDNDKTGNIDKVEAAIGYLIGKSCCNPILQENEDSYFIKIDDESIDLVVNDLANITEIMAVLSFGESDVKKK